MPSVYQINSKSGERDRKFWIVKGFEWLFIMKIQSELYTK